MSRNRELRVLLASGYYDLATPFAAAEWTMDHMGLDPSLAGNVLTTRYESGHMMYIHPPSRERLARELRIDLAAGWTKREIRDALEIIWRFLENPMNSTTIAL